MSPNNTFDAIILGAGISGMSAAMHCIKQGKSPLLIESTANIGGRAILQFHFILQMAKKTFFLPKDLQAYMGPSEWHSECCV